MAARGLKRASLDQLKKEDLVNLLEKAVATELRGSGRGNPRQESTPQEPPSPEQQELGLQRLTMVYLKEVRPPQGCSALSPTTEAGA